MSDQSSSLEVARREAPSVELERPLPPMDDAEVAGAWRTAKALAESGLFPDVRQAGQAFAKMLAGRDLGLTPYESMDALHVIEGKITSSADLHATKVRQRPGYDFRVVWLKIDGEWDGKADARGRLIPPKVVGVASADEDAADLREVYGCAIEFLVDGERRGVSRWTLEDSRASGLLDRKGPKGGEGNHRRFPRSMYFARAMSQGVSLHVPEVMRGLRVYVPEDFAGRRESGEDLGAGAGTTEPAAMDNLPTAVEAVIARATELGHSGLARRERWAALAGQPPEAVGQAVARATRELNAHAARKRRGESEPVAEAEPPDVEVVPDPPAETVDPVQGPEVTDPPAQNEPVSEPAPGEGTTGTDEDAAAQEAQPAPAERDESAEVVDAEHTLTAEQRAMGLRAAAAQLLEDADAAEAEGKPEEAERLRSDAAQSVREADALADPEQSSFGL